MHYKVLNCENTDHRLIPESTNVKLHQLIYADQLDNTMINVPINGRPRYNMRNINIIGLNMLFGIVIAITLMRNGHGGKHTGSPTWCRFIWH